MDPGSYLLVVLSRFGSYQAFASSEDPGPPTPQNANAFCVHSHINLILGGPPPTQKLFESGEDPINLGLCNAKS